MKTLMELLLAETPALAVDIEIAGETFKDVHKLGSFDLGLIEHLYPHPQAPMRQKFNGRAYEAAKPDHEDPEYVKAGAAWHLLHEIRTVAVGLGNKRLGIEPEWPVCDSKTKDDEAALKQAREYIASAVPLVGRLPWVEITEAAKRLRGVKTDQLKAAEGNSSSGAGTVQTPRMDGEPQSPAPTS